MIIFTQLTGYEIGFCYVFGDPYIYTFDGAFYQWHRKCTYSLLQIGTAMQPDFGVFMEIVSCGNRFMPGVSCPGPVEIRAGDSVVRVPDIQTPSRLSVDGLEVILSREAAVIATNVAAKRQDQCAEIAAGPWGIVVVVCPLLISIRAPKHLSSGLGGLCGNFDNRKYNDFRARDGTLYSPDFNPSPLFPTSWEQHWGLTIISQYTKDFLALLTCRTLAWLALRKMHVVTLSTAKRWFLVVRRKGWRHTID
ncbi:mucin-2-like [Oratosquilla oratoria]|uniref:mucin-2-like n=1 Tax=Oratosquilla oratoria TaxID=337810 RepID=UPI003F7671E4